VKAPPTATHSDASLISSSSTSDSTVMRLILKIQLGGSGIDITVYGRQGCSQWCISITMQQLADIVSTYSSCIKRNNARSGLGKLCSCAYAYASSSLYIIHLFVCENSAYYAISKKNTTQFVLLMHLCISSLTFIVAVVHHVYTCGRHRSYVM
jgi:hypothetical protein